MYTLAVERRAVDELSVAVYAFVVFKLFFVVEDGVVETTVVSNGLALSFLSGKVVGA